MKIYTRTGDGGETSLIGGARAPKWHPRLDAYGTLDELNALLGALRLHTGGEAIDAALEAMQWDLFALGAALGPCDAAPDAPGPCDAAPDALGPCDAAPDALGPCDAAPDALGPCDAAPDAPGPRDAAPDAPGPRDAAPDALSPRDAAPDALAGPAPHAGPKLKFGIKDMETDIDRMLPNGGPGCFVLPGGSPRAAAVHHARTVCRRAERMVARLCADGDAPAWTMAYLNRLGDWLFAAAIDQMGVGDAGTFVDF